MPEGFAQSGDLVLPAFVPYTEFKDSATGWSFLVGKIKLGHIVTLRDNDPQIFMTRLIIRCVRVKTEEAFREITTEELLNYDMRLYNQIVSCINEQFK